MSSPSLIKLTVMIVLDKIVISTTEPPSTRVLWVKPTGDGAAFYVFNHGWEPMKVVNDKDTATPYDDEILDIKSDGYDGDIVELVEQEVARQVSEHDSAARDTHNTDSGDYTEYPEVDI